MLMLPVNKKDLFLLLGIGIMLSYVANIFRMSLIIVVGHYYGYEALEFTHANLGWIFHFWIFIFWKLLEYLFPTDVKRYIN